MFYNFLLTNVLTNESAEPTGCTFGPLEIGLIAVMGLLLVAMIVMPMLSRKKQKNQADSLSNIVVGDKIMTIGGIIGIVIEVKTTTGGKEVLIETGEEGSKTTIWIDAKGIYQNLTRPPVATDFFGRPKGGVNTGASDNNATTISAVDNVSHDLEEPKATSEVKLEINAETEFDLETPSSVAPASTRTRTTTGSTRRTTTSSRSSVKEEAKPFEDDGGW